MTGGGKERGWKTGTLMDVSTEFKGKEIKWRVGSTDLLCGFESESALIAAPL